MKPEETKPEKKEELSFTEKLMVDCFKSAKRVFEELKDGKEKFTAEQVVTTAHTFFISAMNSIRDSKREKNSSQQQGNNDRATSSQIAYLQKLGYDGNTDISKAEAHKLIDEIKQNITNY